MASPIKEQQQQQNEIDEATLLKDWDFARFFPSKLSSESPNSRPKQQPEKPKNSTPNHRRMESDSKITNPFFRGFRRENSDFFPMSSRHSAVFERNPNPLRSSGIFNNRRSSDAGIVKKTVGEPVLMDFIKRSSESPSSTSSKNALRNIGVLDEDSSRFYKPRREKTESDIVLRNSEARREARRRDMELRQESRRSSRNVDLSVNSIVLSTATNSIDGDEYLYIQVMVSFVFCFLLSQVGFFNPFPQSILCLFIMQSFYVITFSKLFLSQLHVVFSVIHNLEQISP